MKKLKYKLCKVVWDKRVVPCALFRVLTHMSGKNQDFSGSMIYLQRLLYYTNNKCIATNLLAKLIFQGHSGQKSGLFQDQ